MQTNSPPEGHKERPVSLLNATPSCYYTSRNVKGSSEMKHIRMINNSSCFSRYTYLLQPGSHTGRQHCQCSDYNALKCYRSLSQRYPRLFFFPFEYIYLGQAQTPFHQAVSNVQVQKRCSIQVTSLASTAERLPQMGNCYGNSSYQLQLSVCFLILTARIASADILQLCCYCSSV